MCHDIKMTLTFGKSDNHLSTKHVKIRLVDSLEVEEYSKGDEEGGE